MAIQFECPGCQKKLIFKFLKEQDEFECKYCGYRGIVPVDAEHITDVSKNNVRYPSKTSNENESQFSPEERKSILRKLSLLLHLYCLVFIYFVLFGADITVVDTVYSSYEFLIGILLYLLMFGSSYYILLSKPIQGSSKLFILCCIVFYLIWAGLFTIPIVMLNIGIFIWMPYFWIPFYLFPIITVYLLIVLLKDESKIIRSDNRFLQKFYLPITLVLSSLLLFYFYKSNTPEFSFPDLSGSILIVDEEVECFDLHTGEQKEVFESKLFDYCEQIGFDKNDNLIFKNNFNMISIYDYQNSKLEQIMKFDNAYSYCYYLSYLKNSNQYIYGGKYNHTPGIFLLDTLFNLKEQISDSLDDMSLRFPNHLRVGDTLKNLNDTTITAVINNEGFTAVSPDGKYLVYSYGYKKDKTHRLYNTHEGKSEKMNSGKLNVVDLTFSPNSKFILLRVQTYNIEDRNVYYIYDIENEKLRKTPIYGKGALVWINEKLI